MTEDYKAYRGDDCELDSQDRYMFNFIFEMSKHDLFHYSQLTDSIEYKSLIWLCAPVSMVISRPIKPGIGGQKQTFEALLEEQLRLEEQRLKTTQQQQVRDQPYFCYTTQKNGL
jgi:hypothetical protein